MEKIEIAYKEKYLNFGLFIASLNLFMGFIILLTGRWEPWMGLVWSLVGISQVARNAFERGKENYIIIEQGKLKLTHIFRKFEYPLEGLIQVEKVKAQITLHWEDKKESIYLGPISEQDQTILYSAIKQYATSS